MNLTKVLTVVFSLIAVGLLWFLFSSVKHEIDEKARIKRSEAVVISKLKTIRTAEITYRSVKGQYTDNWDSLKAFLMDGVIYNIQKTVLCNLKVYPTQIQVVKGPLELFL